MVSDLNSIAYLSVSLLELFGELPQNLVLGTDNEGRILYSNANTSSVQLNHSIVAGKDMIENCIPVGPSWKEELATKSTFQLGNFSIEDDGFQFIHAFQLVTKGGNPIKYVFCLQNTHLITENDHPASFENEGEPMIQLINKIIGTANRILKNTKEESTILYANHIYNFAWLLKESHQGSLDELVRRLDPGVDVIDFNELFKTAFDPESYEFDLTKYSIQFTYVPFVFIGDSAGLKELIQMLVEYLHMVRKSESFQLQLTIEEQEGYAKLHVMGKPFHANSLQSLDNHLQQLIKSLSAEFSLQVIGKDCLSLDIMIPNQA